MDVERDIIDEAGRRGLRLTAGSPVPWLTARGHLDPVVQRAAPTEILDVLDELHHDLGGDPRALSRKQLGAPRPDLVVVGTGQLVEIDEVQHFTSDRLASLACTRRASRSASRSTTTAR